MSLNELLKKDFFIYILLRLFSMVIMVLSIFFIFFSKETNISFGLVLFVVSLIILIIVNRIKVPKLATCLNKSNFFVLLIVNTSLSLSIGMTVLVFAFEEVLINKKIFFSILILLFIFGILSYFYCCKKNKILN